MGQSAVLGYPEVTHRPPEVDELLPHLGHKGFLGHQGPVQALVELDQLSVHLCHLEHTRPDSEGPRAGSPQDSTCLFWAHTCQQGIRKSLGWRGNTGPPMRYIVQPCMNTFIYLVDFNTMESTVHNLWSEHSYIRSFLHLGLLLLMNTFLAGLSF